jgi:hypothetical protein
VNLMFKGTNKEKISFKKQKKRTRHMLKLLLTVRQS